MNKKFLLLGLFLAFAASLTQADCQTGCEKKCDTGCAQSINLWQPHAFSAYSSRDIIHKKTFYTNDSDREEWNGMISVATEYMQNFGGKCSSCKNLGARPFWSGTNEMTYGTNNGESDIDAYQFGMGNVIGQGAIQLNPRVQHVGTDIMLHFAQYKDHRGFVFTLQAPIGAMMIDTPLREVVALPDDIVDTVNLAYPSPNARYQTLTQAWQAGSANGNGGVNSSRYNVLAITKGRMASCKQTVIRMADLSAMIGYKVYATEKGFVDIGFKVSCPTGNVPQADFVLEPIFGRAGHWGVGGEVTSHYKIWECESANKGIDFWFQGEALHLFTGRKPSWRSFDLALNGPGSKYMLIQYYFPGNPSTDNPTGRIPSFVTNAVNVTTMPVHSTFGVEGSAAVGFDFYKDNWNFMIGGEFWGRSRECLSFDCCNLVEERSANLNDFAVLGRQVSEDDRSISNNDFVLVLNLCEPEAKINKSQDRVIGVGVPPAVLTYPTSLPAGVKDARLATNRIPANINEALDVAGAAAARAMTGKVFGQFGYTFKEHRYTPNVSVFGSTEFVVNQSNNAVNLWAVGAQASINF
ncbi:MAG: hypothetical protein WC747_03430 [Candidatus Babeliales bacterium]|jgi:hypothetical protein